jgi:hypothetical protein
MNINLRHMNWFSCNRWNSTAADDIQPTGDDLENSFFRLTFWFLYALLVSYLLMWWRKSINLIYLLKKNLDQLIWMIIIQFGWFRTFDFRIIFKYRMFYNRIVDFSSRADYISFLSANYDPQWLSIILSDWLSSSVVKYHRV